MPSPRQIAALQKHLELDLVNSSSNSAKDVLNIINPADKNNTNDGTQGLLIYADGKFYLEIENASHSTHAENIFESEQDKAQAIANGSSHDNNQLLNQNTTYAWKINHTQYQQLITGDEPLLGPTGLVGELLARIRERIYEGDRTKQLNADHVRILEDDWTNDLINQDIDKQKAAFKSQWNRSSNTIGLSDSLWAFLGPLLKFIPKETGAGWVAAGSSAVATILFPFALGYATAYVNYQSQIQAYRENFGEEEPSQAIKDQIWAESKALGWKVFAAVGGWTVGYLTIGGFTVNGLLDFGFNVVDPTGSSRWAAGAIIGLFAAAALVAMAAGQIYRKNGTITPDDALALVCLFVIGTIAGTLWFVINSYTIIPKDALGAGNEALAKILDFALKFVATYLTVSNVFKLLAPENTYKDIKSTKGMFSLLNILGPGYKATETRKTEIAHELDVMKAEATSNIKFNK